MNRALVIAATVSASAAVAATAQTTAAPAEQKEGGEPKMVCKSIQEIGSRLSRRRVCRTQLEWDELEQQTRLTVERVQTTKQTTGN